MLKKFVLLLVLILVLAPFSISAETIRPEADEVAVDDGILEDTDSSGSYDNQRESSEVIFNSEPEIVDEVPGELDKEVEKLSQQEGVYLLETEESYFALISLGQRPTLGYSVEVSGYRVADEEAYVVARESATAEDEEVGKLSLTPMLW